MPDLIKHYDSFNRELNINDVVVYIGTGYKRLKFGQVVKLTPKRVIIRVCGHSWTNTIEPSNCFKIDPVTATELLLLNN